MKLAIDAFGGDHAPAEIIKGSVMALEQLPDLELVLAGDQETIQKELSAYNYDSSRVEILHAPQIITNDDVPTIAIREKKESSIVKIMRRAKEDDSLAGVVSAGSTGAVLTGALLIVGRLDGVDRPALAPILPTVDGKNVLLIDCGANMDCKPEYLLQFAYMGSAYMNTFFGVEKPRVALLSVGTEDKKGNELSKSAFALLKESKLNFVGNMEARDALSGEYDVLVCDGFVGNVALKTLECAVGAIFSVLKQEIEASLRAKIGYLFMKPALRKLKNRLDYNKVGGAPFLGCKKIVVKAHGSSKAEAFAAAIGQAYTMAKNNLVKNISDSLAQIIPAENE